MAQPNQTMASGDDSSSPFRLNGGFNLGSNAQNLNFQNSALSAMPNVLDQYVSYTYNISWYLVTPQDIQSMYQSRSIKALPANRLIVQSGGISGTGRNPNFNVDYYIDKLTMKSTLAGTSGTATSTDNLHMTVIEPHGISFVQTLVKAVNQLYGTSINNAQTGQGGQSTGNQQRQQINPNDAFNLIVITFQGYDANGNIVKGQQNGQIVQKYFITYIQNIEYKVNAKKMIEYEISMNVDYSKAQTMMGAIPQQVELTATTVKDALTGGNANNNSNSNRSNASSAPPTAGSAQNQNSSIRKSIVQILNEFQTQQVKNGIYTYPDQFQIELAPEIASAKVTVTDGLLKTTGSLTEAKAPQKVDSSRQSVEPTVRNLGFEAGTSVVQAIELVIRNSTYITNQSNTKISEKTGQATPNQSQKPNSQLNWFKVNMQTIPLKWDPKRNNYAYKYRYVVTPFKLATMQSQYFNQPNSPGIHKRYDFMFTGLNTQVIDWEMNMKNQYTTFMTSSTNNVGVANQALSSTVAKRLFAPRSGQSSQGAAGKTNEVAANAADYLYDPTAMSNVDITIIGDPAWILQGERWQLDAAVSANPTAPLGGGGAGRPFLPDGTINVDYGHILFELVVNTPKDYDVASGLMNPNTQVSQYKTAQTATPGMSAQSYILQASSVTSDFAHGKFTQKLSGWCVQYNPDQTTRYASARTR